VDTHYLAIACDRHQRLRLIGPKATIIEGLNFGLHTKRLSRNYRNSFPVYAASLAILFRWLAKYGKVILPTKKEFEEEFGIRVEERAEGKSVIISSWNDSHPANYWNFTTTKFNTCRDCYDLLKSQNLSREQVLWVRFRKEEPYFNYEKLADLLIITVATMSLKRLLINILRGRTFPLS